MYTAEHEAVKHHAFAAGRAKALDNAFPATPEGLDPAQVTAAAKNEAVASGSGKAISSLPTPQNGGATPTPTPTPVPYPPINPPNPAAYVHVRHSLLPVLAVRPFTAMYALAAAALILSVGMVM